MSLIDTLHAINRTMHIGVGTASIAFEIRLRTAWWTPS